MPWGVCDVVMLTYSQQQQQQQLVMQAEIISTVQLGV